MTTTMQRPTPPPAVQPKHTSAASRNVKKILPSGLQLIILAVLVLFPVGFVLLAAFTDTSPGPGSLGEASFTITNFKVLFTGSALSAMLNSALVGLGSSILALIIGSGMAFLAARTNVPGRKLIYFFGIAPLFLPALVGALAWAQLGSPASGFINVVARAVGIPDLFNIYTFGGLIFVLGLYYAPYTFLMVHSALSLMNPDLEDAASLHGAPLTKMLRTITFPLVMPAIVGSGILVFALTVENFPVAQVIGVPGQIDTLPTLIYRLMNASPSRQNAAAAIAVVLTVLLMVVVFVQQRTVAKKQYTTVSGKGVRARRVPLRRRWPAAIAAWVYFLLAVVLPIGALLISALQTSPYLGQLSQLFEPGALSFWSMGQTLQDAEFWHVLQNSVIVGLGTAFIGTALCFALSYTRYRTNAWGRKWLEYIAMLPLAIPAIVLGLGLLWTWLTLPIPVYGTLIVLVIACIAVFIPQGYRGVSSSIVQLDKDLEDSAIMLGARRPKAISFVTVPLLRVGLSSTFLLLLMLGMRELTAVLFLFTSDTRLLSIAIFDAYDNGSFQQAAELSLLYIVVIGILAVLARRLGAKDVA
jgi:iron(III) transport system permease protein